MWHAKEGPLISVGEVAHQVSPGFLWFFADADGSESFLIDIALWFFCGQREVGTELGEGLCWGFAEIDSKAADAVVEASIVFDGGNVKVFPGGVGDVPRRRFAPVGDTTGG